MDDRDYELYHFGVKGMKWGVRKKKQTSSIVSRKRNKSDDLYDQAREAQRRGNLIKSNRLKNEADRRAQRERSGMANIDDAIGRVKKIVDKHNAKKRQKQEADQLRRRQAEYDENVQRNWYKAYNKAADYANSILIPQINEKYKKMLSDPNKTMAEYEAYEKEYEDLFNMKWQEFHDEMFGKRPE